MRSQPSYGARRLAAVLLVLSACPLAAQEDSPFGDPDEKQRQLEPPLPLPQGKIGTIRPQGDAPQLKRINTIREIFEAVRACWRPPAGSGYSGQELTLQLSFKRNGEVLGQPRITYYKAGTQPDQREPFTRAVREAFERCTPLPFTDSLGGAVAGQPFVFRFIDSQPM